MGGEEDGLALYRRACRVTGLDLRTLPVCGPGVRRPGAPRSEADADAGPAAPQAPPCWPTVCAYRSSWRLARTWPDLPARCRPSVQDRMGR